MFPVVPVIDNLVCNSTLVVSFLQARLAAICRLTGTTAPAPTDHTTAEETFPIDGRFTPILPIGYHIVRGGLDGFHLFLKNNLTVISSPLNEVVFESAQANKHLPKLLTVSCFSCLYEQVAFAGYGSVYPGFTLVRTAESTGFVITDG